MGEAEDDNDNNNKDRLVRQRPVWLERLMTAAQQQLFAPSETRQSVETVSPKNNEIVETSAAVEPVSNNPQVSIHSPTNTQQPTSPSEGSRMPFDPESVCFDSDSLPSLDLSQLTLDSELIFPS